MRGTYPIHKKLLQKIVTLAGYPCDKFAILCYHQYTASTIYTSFSFWGLLDPAPIFVSAQPNAASATASAEIMLTKQNKIIAAKSRID